MSIVDPSVLELLNHAESRYTLVVEALTYDNPTEQEEQN